MKIVRLVGLYLMALLALGAGIATSASAGELLFKATKGNVVGGRFEVLGGLQTVQILGGSTIRCEHLNGHGRFLSTTLGDILILFSGCGTESFGKVNCHNTGTNEIHLPLESTLFHLGLAHLGSNTSIPALDILLDKNLKFECSIVTVTLKGAAIGALQVPLGAQEPLNTPEKEVNLVHKESAPGMQELTEFLMPGGGLVKQHLTFTILPEEECALESTNTLNNFKNNEGAATEIELVEP